MVPKVLIRIREHILNAASPTGKARASRYNHTHADCDSINIPLVLIFPSNKEINKLAVQAFEEAQNLLTVTGIFPSTTRSSHILPNINTWFPSDSDHSAMDNGADLFKMYNNSDDDGYPSDGEEQGDSGKIFDYIESGAYGNLLHAEMEEVEGLGYAAIVSSVGNSMHM